MLPSRQKAACVGAEAVFRAKVLTKDGRPRGRTKSACGSVTAECHAWPVPTGGQGLRSQEPISVPVFAARTGSTFALGAKHRAGIDLGVGPVISSSITRTTPYSALPPLHEGISSRVEFQFQLRRSLAVSNSPFPPKHRRQSQNLKHGRGGQYPGVEKAGGGVTRPVKWNVGLLTKIAAHSSLVGG